MRLSRMITAPTARRGHVERVATSCAMRIKYSSQEGRTFFRVSWEFEASAAGSLKRSIEPVSGIAKAWDDERAVVEFRVDGCGVEGHVGVLAGNPFDAWHRSDRVEAGDPGRSLFLEFVYGGREAPPRCEHRVENEDQILVKGARIWTWRVGIFPVASPTRIRASSFIACLKSAVVVRSSRRTASLWRLKGSSTTWRFFTSGVVTHTAGKPP